MKSYTDLEQSHKLAEFLPLESADMKFYYNHMICDYEERPYVGSRNYDECSAIPCWSLAALLDVLQIYTIPTAFSTNISVPSLTKNKNGYSITYVGDYRIMESNNNDIESPIEIVADNPIDTAYEMILKLHKLNFL